MPSDNSEEIEFESVEESQPPSGEERIRPGLLGMNWKIVLWLAAVGLIPVLMMLPVMLPMVRSAPEIHRQIAAQADDLRQAAADSQQALADLKKQIADESLKKQLEAYEKSTRRSFKDLGKKLSGLIPAEKKPEEIAADQGLKKAVETAAGPFSEVGLWTPRASRCCSPNSPSPPGPWRRPSRSCTRRLPPTSRPPR